MCSPIIGRDMNIQSKKKLNAATFTLHKRTPYFQLPHQFGTFHSIYFHYQHHGVPPVENFQKYKVIRIYSQNPTHRSLNNTR